MEWKTFGATFLLVFLAELGDKTQLATIGITSSGKHPVSVFAGSAFALVLSSLLAVAVGVMLDSWIPRHILRTAAGVFFIAAGGFILLNK